MCHLGVVIISARGKYILDDPGGNRIIDVRAKYIILENRKASGQQLRESPCSTNTQVSKDSTGGAR